MRNPHPGTILMKEIRELNISKSTMSRRLGIPHGEFLALCSGRAPVTPEIAQRLSVGLYTSTEFWMKLQRDYDESHASHSTGDPK